MIVLGSSLDPTVNMIGLAKTTARASRLVDSLPSSWTGEFSFSSREGGCAESAALRNRLNLVMIRCPMISLVVPIDGLEAYIGHNVPRILSSQAFGNHTAISCVVFISNEPSSRLNLDDCSRVYDARGGGGRG